MSGFQTRLPDLQALIQCSNTAITCLQETHLRPSPALNIGGCTGHRYYHSDGDRSSGGTAVVVKDCISYVPDNLRNLFRSLLQHICQSSAILLRTPAPWWTDECREAIRVRKRALRYFRADITLENLISLKCFLAKAQRVLREAMSFFLAFPSPRVSLLRGTKYSVFQRHTCQLCWRCLHHVLSKRSWHYSFFLSAV
jgi:hypothetical protein